MEEEQAVRKLQVENEIFKLEREVSDLNLRYRRLQTTTRNECSSANSGVELKQVMQSLEAKSQDLFAYKKER